MSTRYLLKDWRLAFGQGLWTKSKPPKAGSDAKEKFRVTLLGVRNHPQLKEIQGIIRAEAQALFGPKWEAILKGAEAQQKVCLRDGDLKSEYEGFADHWAISANSFTRPSVFDAQRNPVTQDSGVVYSGCYVNAIIAIKAFDNVSKGVTAELSGVQFWRRGDAFAGGKVAEADEFPDEIAAPAEEDELTK